MKFTLKKLHFRRWTRSFYLGCELRKYGDIRNEINIRIGKAGAAFRGLSKVWNEKGISLRTKFKLLKRNFKSA